MEHIVACQGRLAKCEGSKNGSREEDRSQSLSHREDAKSAMGRGYNAP